MIDLELSRGTIGPGDLKAIGGRLKALTARTLSLNSFANLVSQDVRLASKVDHDPRQSSDLSRPASGDSENSSSPTPVNKIHHHHHRHEPKHYNKLITSIQEREARLGHDLPSLVPLLRDSSAPLRRAALEGLKDITSWIETINNTRWRKSGPETDVKEKEDREIRESRRLIEVLENALKEFQEADGMVGEAKEQQSQDDTREGGGRRRLLVGPFGKFFEGDGQLKGGPGGGPSRIKREHLHPSPSLLPSNDKNQQSQQPNQPFAARSLFLCFVFTSTLEAYAIELIAFLKFIVDLRERRRGEKRIWFPSGFGKLWRKIKKDGGDGEVGTNDPFGTGSGGRLTERERKEKKMKDRKDGKRNKKELGEKSDSEDESEEEEESKGWSDFSSSHINGKSDNPLSLPLIPLPKILPTHL